MSVRLRHRLDFLVILLVTVTGLLILRLAYVQVILGEGLRGQAEKERWRRVEFDPPPRGLIYDRDGFLLTVNRECIALIANPILLAREEDAPEMLAPILHLPSQAIGEAIDRAATAGVSRITLNPDATMQEGEAFRRLDLGGLEVDHCWIRRYPHAPMAASLLGFVSGGGQGYYGLEGFYDSELRVDDQTWEGEMGPTGSKPLPQEEGAVPLPAAGEDLILTVDWGVQAVVEEELARALNEFRADRGTVIVMDPRTGAILAMASQPSFDANRHEWYIHLDQEGVFRNLAVGDPYEPGSTFKIITVAAALDSGAITPSYREVVGEQIELGGHVYFNWDSKAYGECDLADILGYSLNVGAVQIALQAGPETFYQHVRAFGFGQPTGVDLEGELPGEVRMSGSLDWHDADLGTNSFGQGLTATPIQMIAAVAAVANEGRLMRPYLVAGRKLADGDDRPHDPVQQGQPISPQTARDLTEILAQAVERHLRQVLVPGYRIAGKTGTAQIPVAGGYDSNRTIASFVGYGPVRDPQLVILVRLDHPRTSIWASQTSALVFQRLASRLFPMLGIPPDGE